jgi:predicted Fe-Mo cluster-binding NifX family protein
MEKVAVPQLDDAVAPRFEAARHFLIAETDSGGVTRTQVITCEAPDGYRRVRMLQIHRVSVLICNGIKSSYRDVLVASGVKVITQYSGSAAAGLEEFLAGKIRPEECYSDENAELYPVPHADLVERAKGLFGGNGYKVAPGPGDDSSLIDLIAEMLCPVCGKPVRVAICCGAHTYRADQEIAQFHQATLSGYHARVYVSPIQPAIWQCCREYGIEPLDPDQPAELRAAESGGAIPLLSGPVISHERASNRGAL